MLRQELEAQAQLSQSDALALEVHSLVGPAQGLGEELDGLFGLFEVPVGDAQVIKGCEFVFLIRELRVFQVELDTFLSFPQVKVHDPQPVQRQRGPDGVVEDLGAEEKTFVELERLAVPELLLVEHCERVGHVRLALDVPGLHA